MTDKLVQEVSEVLDEHHAEDILVLDISKHTAIADYFVIATATSRAHLEALTDALKDRLSMHVHHREGSPRSDWVLVDMRDVVVHLFLPEARAFYNLERLWADLGELPTDEGSGG